MTIQVVNGVFWKRFRWGISIVDWSDKRAERDKIGN